MSVRLAIAIIAATATATALYAALRVAQSLLFSEADPALVLWSPHAGFIWRAWTAAYLGTMIGFAAWAVSARRLERTARHLGVGIVVAIVLIAAQGVLVP